MVMGMVAIYLKPEDRPVRMNCRNRLNPTCTAGVGHCSTNISNGSIAGRRERPLAGNSALSS